MRFLKRKVSWVAFLSNAKLMDCSGWYLNTVVVHGVHRADLVLEAVQRDAGEQRAPKSRGDPLCRDAARHQHSQRQRARHQRVMRASNPGMLGV